jgi:DNA-binding NarL/FixJ family response regulator
MLPTFSVLVGNANPPVSQCLKMLIEHAADKRFTVSLIDFPYWDDLAAHADKHGFDMLMVNLTQTTDRQRSGMSQVEMTAANVTEFKSRYGKPIIILTTWDKPGMVARLDAAGADAIIRMPFTLADIMPSIERCMTASKCG